MAAPNPLGLATHALDAVRATVGAADRLGELVDAVLDIRAELQALRVQLDPRIATIERELAGLHRDVVGVRKEVARIRGQLAELTALMPDPQRDGGLLARAVDAVTPDGPSRS